MSELQTALLAIGLGVIVVIYLAGWWQQRQYRRKYGSVFKAQQGDALYQVSAPVTLAEEVAIPTAPPTDSPLEPITHHPIIVDEVVVEDEPLEASKVELAPPVLAAVEEVSQPTRLDESCALLDVRSDFIIELKFAEPSPAAVLDGFWQRKFDFAKPVQVCGLTLQTQQWERAIAESQTLYTHCKLSLQLVDRGGAISQAKLADFRDLVLGIAKQIKAESSVPAVEITHAEALKLDAWCASVDQMVGVNLIPPGDRTLQGHRLEQAVNLFGLTLQSDGAFHALNAQGNSLFTLINQDTKPFQHHTLENCRVSGVTLLLDVPRVESPAQQFDQMMRVAHGLAQELQVNVVDDQRVLLSDVGIALIRAQITAVESKMLVNGIMPGSAQARRLFS